MLIVQLSDTGDPPPGWYEQKACLRYWDGLRWTEHLAPLPAGDAAGPESTTATAPILKVGISILAIFAVCALAFALIPRHDTTTASQALIAKSVSDLPVLDDF